VAELLAIAGFNTSIPILPFYLGDLGIKDPEALKVWVGIAQSVGAVTLAVMSPIWGRLADSYGRRLMLLRSMFGGFVVLALMGFVREPWQLIVLRGMQGALTGTIGAATVLVASIAPEKETGYALGLLQTAVFAGASLGPLIGGTLSDAFGNRVPFWVTAVLLAAAGLIVLVFVKEEFQPSRVSGSLANRIFPDLGVLTRTKGLLSLLVAVATVQIANSVVGPILPMFIQSLEPGSTLVASATGVILGASALSGAVASAAVGKVSHRIGYRRALLLCVIGSCLLTIPQAFVRSTAQLLMLRVVGALFLGGTAPTVNATIAGLADRAHHGAVYGLSSSISSIGMSLGPMIGAGVGVLWGFPAVFLTTAAILLGTAVALGRGQRISHGIRRLKAIAPQADCPTRDARLSSGPDDEEQSRLQ
jgi:DHA1 family multidrug resistance protein-like MFS transporter